MSICSSETNSLTSWSERKGGTLVLIWQIKEGVSGRKRSRDIIFVSSRFSTWLSVCLGFPLVEHVGKQSGGSTSPCMAPPSPYVAITTLLWRTVGSPGMTVYGSQSGIIKNKRVKGRSSS